MKTGLIVVVGGISDINEKIFKSLEKKAISRKGKIKVKKRLIALSKKKNLLLRAEVSYEIKM